MSRLTSWLSQVEEFGGRGNWDKTSQTEGNGKSEAFRENHMSAKDALQGARG